MRHLLYLAGALSFVFGFFYFSNYTSDNTAFIYLQYASLLMAFWFLILGIQYWSSGRAPSMTSGAMSDMRREKWRQQKIDRKKRRRYN